MVHSNQRFPAARRLRKNEEFRRVFAGRRSAGDELMIVYAWPNALGYSRLGLSVSRKHGNAVARNRWKRLFREAFRLDYHALPQGYDFVLIPRQGAIPQLAPLRASLEQLARRVVRRLQREGKTEQARAAETRVAEVRAAQEKGRQP